jgi:hypothetical protein
MDFNDLPIEPAQDFVQSQIIDTMMPHVTSFVSAMAGVLVIKMFLFK